MNTKEKDELRERSREKFCIWYYAQPQPLDANVIHEYLLKALEALEQPRTSQSDRLDAGEFMAKHCHPNKIPVIGHTYDLVIDLMQAFAQASIIAKQREWEEELTKLKFSHESIDGGYYTDGITDAIRLIKTRTNGNG